MPNYFHNCLEFSKTENIFQLFYKWRVVVGAGVHQGCFCFFFMMVYFNLLYNSAGTSDESDICEGFTIF